MRPQQLLALVLWMACCLALSAVPAEAQRNMVPPWPAQEARPHARLMSDSLYDSLSAMPLDSLSARHYDLLMRERTLRAEKANPIGRGFLIGLGVAGALLLVSLLLSGL